MVLPNSVPPLRLSQSRCHLLTLNSPHLSHTGDGVENWRHTRLKSQVEIRAYWKQQWGNNSNNTNDKSVHKSGCLHTKYSPSLSLLNNEGWILSPPLERDILLPRGDRVPSHQPWDPGHEVRWCWITFGSWTCPQSSRLCPLTATAKH